MKKTTGQKRAAARKMRLARARKEHSLAVTPDRHGHTRQPKLSRRATALCQAMALVLSFVIAFFYINNNFTEIHFLVVRSTSFINGNKDNENGGDKTGSVFLRR